MNENLARIQKPNRRSGPKYATQRATRTTYPVRNWRKAQARRSRWNEQ